MSIKPTGPKLPSPEILTLTPVPEVSVTFHDKRTVAAPPIVTLEGFATNELIVGAWQAAAVTVAVALDCAPQPAVAIN